MDKRLTARSGFFDMDVARTEFRKLKSDLGLLKTGQVTSLPDCVCRTGQQETDGAVPAPFGSSGLLPDEHDGGLADAGKVELDGLDQAHQGHFHRVDLGVDEPELIGHSSLLRSVGTDEGTARPEATKDVSTSPRSDAADAALPTRRTAMLPRLKAGLDRFEDSPAAAVIGAALVFALPVIVLAIGALVGGGM
jgi:hypothetical protein